MNAFLYGVKLQWKLDIRSKTLLVTCYLVPLLFFILMGGIFTSVMPEMKETLVPAMVIMGVSMGALLGMPSSLLETYGSSVKKVYRANGVPLYFGLAAIFLSSLIHLLIMSTIILLTAPVLFDAELPADGLSFFAALVLYTAVSLGMGSVLGLMIKNQAKLNMAAQLLFLPSIMLSGIMFPAEFLPKALKTAGEIFPASWGYRLMLNQGFEIGNLWYPLIVLFAALAFCAVLLKKQEDGVFFSFKKQHTGVR